MKKKEILLSIRNKISFFASQGLSVHQLALGIALGTCLGIMPVLGVTTFLCAIVAGVLRLNMALVQAINYMVYPLQLLLYIPFFKAGAWFSGQEFPYALSDIQTVLAKDLWTAIHLFFTANVYAFIVWLLCAPFLIFFLYGVSTWFLRRKISFS